MAILTLNSVLWAMEALLLAAMQMSICWQSRIGCNLRADKSVIEEQGKYAVFVRESKEHFEKRPVAIAEQTASVLK